MINRLTPIIGCILMLCMLITSCGVPGPAGAWISHVNKVLAILKGNPDDAAEAAQKVIEYLAKNEEKIKGLSAQLKQLSPGEAEKVYEPVLEAQQTLIDYIKTHTTDTYPLGSMESFINALQILFQ